MGIDWLTREIERVEARPGVDEMLKSAQHDLMERGHSVELAPALVLGGMSFYREEARALAIEAVKEVERLRAEIDELKQETS